MAKRPSPEKTSVSVGSKYEQYGYSPVFTSHTLEPWFREWTGSDSPGFPAELETNQHYVHIMTRRQQSNCVAYQKVSNTNWYRYTGPMQGYGVAVPSAYSLASEDNAREVKSLATARLIRKVSRTKVNLVQNLAEYRQVRNMFTLNAWRIWSAFRSLRRGDIDGMTRYLRLDELRRRRISKFRNNPKWAAQNASQVWLEIQYGWKPLVSDVYDALTSFYSSVEQGAFIRERARASRKWDVATSNVSGAGIVRYDRVTRRKAVCMTEVRYRVDNSRLANLQDWGITNPLLLAWELLPYSFVVDWFVPVGDWLENLHYHLGLLFEDGFESAMVRANSLRVYKPVPTVAPTVRTVNGTDEYGEVTWRRSKLTAWPTPPPPFTFDENGLRGLRIGNALALLGAAFGKDPYGVRRR